MAIAVFSVAAVLYILVIPAKARTWALMIASIVAIYWLQPALPIRFTDFILPTLTIILIVIGWLFTRNSSDPAQQESIRQDHLLMICSYHPQSVGQLFYLLFPTKRPSPVKASHPL